MFILHFPSYIQISTNFAPFTEVFEIFNTIQKMEKKQKPAYWAGSGPRPTCTRDAMAMPWLSCLIDLPENVALHERRLPWPLRPSGTGRLPLHGAARERPPTAQFPPDRRAPPAVRGLANNATHTRRAGRFHFCGLLM
jgi:hypothetical protein